MKRRKDVEYNLDRLRDTRQRATTQIPKHTVMKSRHVPLFARIKDHWAADVHNESILGKNRFIDRNNLNLTNNQGL